MRFAVDTGGTFTDLVMEDDRGVLHMFKAATTPDDPVRGILDVVDAAARAFLNELDKAAHARRLEERAFARMDLWAV